MQIADDVLRLIVDEYTREAGVRNLERELGTVLRKTATRIASGQATPPVAVDEAVVRDALGRQKVFQEAAARTAVPGVATGLAVTGTGGDVLFVEANAMTGEVTLQGRVLPIGGLKQKVLAAHAAGLTDVILPERNRGDLDDVPADVREQMTFHPVMTVGEVLELALEPVAAQAKLPAAA